MGSSSGRRLYIQLWYGMMRCTYISTSGLVGRIVCLVQLDY